MDIHRRSSIEDQDVIFNHNQMFMPGSLDSGHSLAMSAPANIGYGYPPNQSFNIGTVQSSLDNVAQGNSVGSYEDDYTAQMK
jgi:hypothetical protein